MGASSTVQADDLGRLHQRGRATIYLSVPLVDDIVQVGIGGDFPTTRLVVSVTASAVRVRRLDGRPLQVHVVEDWRDADDPGLATAVFAEPVGALLLERRAGRWRPSVGGTVGLERFVGTLARFALLKQSGAGGTDQAAGAA
ncbi:hypothetical protein FR943_26235 [Mycobacterium sp. TNTM28]|uniref:Uncharacterized protein n=1 Tax=[Mycobacterium] fortunisiensis TaxID=2600579 RepID=A0ABS6KV00_9MYCO|nr:hypothetical protein [[Mycobacterium] fortunisiensis]MBU9767319.1 hypothetical protein [[Mycobacterium] fortunisiensis]